MAAVSKAFGRAPTGGTRGWPSKLATLLLRPAWQPAVIVTGLGVLVAASTVLRLEGRRNWLWVDEGISLGIASKDIDEIAGLLRDDGSPPLFFLALKGWMNLVGRSEADVHALSMLFAVCTVPVAFWAGYSLFGRRAGWICSLLAATHPYLTFYSREARMYTMVALLALLAVTTCLHAFAFRRRRYLPAFVLTLTLVLYTHNWALFLALGLLAATLCCVLAAEDPRRSTLDALIAFGSVGLLYAPWVPTLIHQKLHTGAPWLASRPPREVISDLSDFLGGPRVVIALLLTAGLAVGTALLRTKSAQWPAVAALALTVTVTPLAAWASSLLEPSWAARYFGTFLFALLLLAAFGLSQDGFRGLIALALVVLFWTKPLSWVSGIRYTPPLDEKSNVRRVAAELRPLMRPGDLVVSAQVEQVPLLHYYFPPGLIYATPEGVVSDPGVVDWSDAVSRLNRATVDTGLKPLVDRLSPSNRVFLVCPHFVAITPADYALPDDHARAQQQPIFDVAADLELENSQPSLRERAASWPALVVRHCRTSLRYLSANPRMQLLAGPTPAIGTAQRGTSVFVFTYQKGSV